MSEGFSRKGLDAERRSPAFYATRSDVALLVALITVVDTIIKGVFKLG